MEYIPLDIYVLRNHDDRINTRQSICCIRINGECNDNQSFQNGYQMAMAHSLLAMFPLRVICTSAFLGISVGSFYVAAMPASMPVDLFVTPIVHDFGEVKQGDKLAYHALLTNTSDSTINLLRPRTSCSCTTSHLEGKSLSPGDSTTLEITWNVGQRRFATQINTVLQYRVGIEKSERTIILQARASVIPVFLVTPTSLTFNEVESQQFVIECTRNPEWLQGIVTDVYSTDPHISTRLEQSTDKLNSKIHLHYTPDSDNSHSQLESAQLIIKTNSDIEPQLNIPMYFQ